jgi:hypothetical protein
VYELENGCLLQPVPLLDIGPTVRISENKILSAPTYVSPKAFKDTNEAQHNTAATRHLNNRKRFIVDLTFTKQLPRKAADGDEAK